MLFVEQAVQDSMDIWEKCFQHPFLQEMADGTLKEEKFKNYIIQDSIYLREYARVHAAAMYKSTTLKDLQIFYKVLGLVNEGEGAVRLRYLEKFGINDDDIDKIQAKEENLRYTSYMLSIAGTSDVPEIMMSVLPCALSYHYLFKRLTKNNPNIINSRYWDIIQEYISDEYKESCIELQGFTEEKCLGIDEERKKKLIQIFHQSSVYELDFWNMSYREE